MQMTFHPLLFVFQLDRFNCSCNKKYNITMFKKYALVHLAVSGEIIEPDHFTFSFLITRYSHYHFFWDLCILWGTESDDPQKQHLTFSDNLQLCAGDIAKGDATAFHIHGETWHEGPCVTCRCSNGNISCATEECPQPLCHQEEVIQLDGECCSLCPFSKRFLFAFPLWNVP